MCLLLEILWVKKCRNFSVGEIFPFHSKYFPIAENLELPFRSTAFVEKIIRGNIYREYVYSAVVYQKYLTRLRELIIFEPWRENYHFSQPS